MHEPNLVITLPLTRPISEDEMLAAHFAAIEALSPGVVASASSAVLRCPGCCNCQPSNYDDPSCGGDGRFMDFAGEAADA